MAQICITIPDIDHHSAKQLAEAQGISMAAFIRAAIQAAIRNASMEELRRLGVTIPEASLFSDDAIVAIKEIAERRQQSVEDYVCKVVEQFERQAALRVALDGVEIDAEYDPNDHTDGGYAGAWPAADTNEGDDNGE